jgi:hypothetical protein
MFSREKEKERERERAKRLHFDCIVSIDAFYRRKITLMETHLFFVRPF